MQTSEIYWITRHSTLNYLAYNFGLSDLQLWIICITTLNYPTYKLDYLAYKLDYPNF